MLLLLFSECLFLLHFWQDLCKNRYLDFYRNQYVFCLIGFLCYLGMTEESKERDKMFNGVDDGEWDISDDDDDDLKSDNGKE